MQVQFPIFDETDGGLHVFRTFDELNYYEPWFIRDFPHECFDSSGRKLVFDHTLVNGTVMRYWKSSKLLIYVKPVEPEVIDKTRLAELLRRDLAKQFRTTVASFQRLSLDHLISQRIKFGKFPQ